jgi:hypothetical protein
VERRSAGANKSLAKTPGWQAGGRRNRGWSVSALRHDAFGATGSLKNENAAGRLEPAPIASFHGLGAGDDAARRQVGPPESNWMFCTARHNPRRGRSGITASHARAPE